MPIHYSTSWKIYAKSLSQVQCGVCFVNVHHDNKRRRKCSVATILQTLHVNVMSMQLTRICLVSTQSCPGKSSTMHVYVTDITQLCDIYMAYVHLTSITRDICTCSLIYSETVICSTYSDVLPLLVSHYNIVVMLNNSSERRIQKILTARKTEGVLLTYTFRRMHK